MANAATTIAYVEYIAHKQIMVKEIRTKSITILQILRGIRAKYDS